MRYKHVVTDEGKAILKLMNREYLNALKEGFNEEQSRDIALARVRQHER